MQRITYQHRSAFKPQSVRVRKSRTLAESRKQYDRIVALALAACDPTIHMNKIQDTYARTYCALHATGRGADGMKPQVKLINVEG